MSLIADEPRLSIFRALDVYDDDEPRSAAMNMAIDQTLLENAKVPSLRFYRWDHPALSFGYFGHYADVSSLALERDLVRRWTGGGIVLHGSDLTYSIVIPVRDRALTQSSTAIYEITHRAIRNVLVATGQRADLTTVAAVYDRRNHVDSAVADRRYNEHSCFANPVRADVLVDGRKVAGAAQRKTRTGLLQQGSIQHVDLTGDFGERFARQLAENCDRRELNDAVLGHAHQITEQRYGSQAWLRRR